MSYSRVVSDMSGLYFIKCSVTTCRLPDEEAGEIPAACVVMNPNAKES